MAQQPLEQYQRKYYADLLGGLNTRADDLNIPANKFTVLNNARTADHDILEKAPGYVLDGSPFPNAADSFIRMLVNYRVGTSVNSLVVAAQDDGNTNSTFKVDFKQSFGDGTYSYIGYTTGTATFTNGSTAVTGSGTLWATNLKAGDKIKPNLYSNWYEISVVNSDTSLTLSSSYTDTTASGAAYMARIILNLNNIPVSVTINNKLLITNGTDTPMEFDNATMSLLQSANAPKAQFIEKHKNRVFMASTSGNPSRLFWSAVNDETTWSSSSKVDVFPNDNGNIVAIRSFAGSLIVFKSNGAVYRVVGEFDQDAVGAPARIIQIDTQDNIGTIFGRSVVVNDDNRLYFLAQTGVYSVNYNMLIEKASWDIQPTIAGLLTSGSLSASKAFSFNTKSSWDTGTLAGLSDTRVANAVSPFFDSLNISGALQGPCCSSVVIDSSNDVHVAWITSDRANIKYTKWLASDNTSSTQQVFAASTVVTYPGADGGQGTTSIDTIHSVAIDVASNGHVGIAYVGENNAFTSGGIVVSQYFVGYNELTSGTWTVKGVDSGQFKSAGNLIPIAGTWYWGQSALSMSFGGGTNPTIACGLGGTRTGASYPAFHVLSGGSFTNVSLTGNGQTNPTSLVAPASCHHILSGSNVYIAMDFGMTQLGVVYFFSSDGGGTFSTPLSSSSLGVPYLAYSGATHPGRYVSIDLDNNNQVIITYNFNQGSGGDTGKIIRYNVTPHTPLKTTVDAGQFWLDGYVNNGSGAECYYGANSSSLEKYEFDTTYSTGTATFVSGNATVTGSGTKWTSWIAAGDTIWLASDNQQVAGTVQSVGSDTSLTLTATYAGSSGSGAAYISARRNTATATGSQAVDTSTLTLYNNTLDLATGSSIAQNGLVIATSTPSVSANVVLVRRTAVRASWLSPVESDTGLTAWGAFSATDSPGGNSIIYEVGANTTSTIPVGNTYITSNGTLISSNPANVFVQTRATYTLSAFAQQSTSSIVLNYTGSGVAGSYPVAFVFNNEMYLAATDTGNTTNNFVIFLDRYHSWSTDDLPFSAFARYNQSLYAGSSSSGKVFRLGSGLAYNGSAYTMTATSKEDVLGSIERQKDIYKAYVLYRVQSSGTFTFSYRLDSYKTSGGSAWTDTVIDQTGASATLGGKPGVAEILIGAEASSVQFKISQADSGVQVGIIGVVFVYAYLNDR